MLREYIISEAMHALGIPTTRSLAVVTTGEQVYREDRLRGAVLTRVAASHLRVGTFQYVAAQGDVATLRALADYAIARHYPELSADAHPEFFWYLLSVDATCRRIPIANQGSDHALRPVYKTGYQIVRSWGVNFPQRFGHCLEMV